MHSIALFCRLFLVVLPALAAPSDTKSSSSVSSTSGSVSSTSAPSSSSSSSSVLSSSISSTTGSTSASSSSSSVLSSSTSSRTGSKRAPSSSSSVLSSSTSSRTGSKRAPSSSSSVLSSSSSSRTRPTSAPSSRTNDRSSRPHTRSSSTSASSVSPINIGSILAGPNPSASPNTVDPSIAASFAKLAAEFGEFEIIIAKGLRSLDALTSSAEAASIRTLIATNEQLAYKLSQAQTALAASKALALRNAKQAQSDIATGKKACSLIQNQLDKWAEIGKDASVSYMQASGVATGLSYYIRYPISSFRQESAALGCPGKGGKVCDCVQTVILVLSRSQQSITGVANSGSGEQGMRQKAAAVTSVVQSVEQSIQALQDALMC